MTATYMDPPEPRAARSDEQTLNHYSAWNIFTDVIGGDWVEGWLEHSNPLFPVEQLLVFPAPPTAVGDVTIHIEAVGALADPTNLRFLDLYMWDRNFGRILQTGIFTAGIGDRRTCPDVSTFDLTITRDQFETLRPAPYDISEFLPEGSLLMHVRDGGPEGYRVLFNTCYPPVFRLRARLEFDYLEDPAELLGWTLNRCANVAFVPVYRQGAIAATVQSAHPVRMVATPLSAGNEVCKHHRGRVVIGPDGFGRLLYCSNDDVSGAPESKRNHYAVPTIVQAGNTDLKGMVPEGFGCFVGSFNAPPFTELQVWADVELCGGQN